jgi:hypothetical protein
MSSSRARLVADRDLQILDDAAAGTQLCEDPVAQRLPLGEERLETGADVARRRENRYVRLVERKHALAAAARLHFPLRGIDDCVNNLERLAGAGANEPADGAMERPGQRRFQVSSLSQQIDALHFPMSPARTAASTMSPAAGAAVALP